MQGNENGDSFAVIQCAWESVNREFVNLSYSRDSSKRLTGVRRGGLGIALAKRRCLFAVFRSIDRMTRFRRVRQSGLPYDRRISLRLHGSQRRFGRPFRGHRRDADVRRARRRVTDMRTRFGETANERAARKR